MSDNLDAEYRLLAQRPEENADELSQIVIQRALENGYTIPAFHGAEMGADFHVFDMPVREHQTGSGETVSTGHAFFSSDEDVAASYGDVIPVVLRLDNPLVVNAKGRTYKSFVPYHYIWGAAKAGNDGVVVQRIRDNAKMSGTEATTYIVFDPSQIKSARAVERDNDGNIIPLANRFLPGSDIRGGPAPLSIEIESIEDEFGEPDYRKAEAAVEIARIVDMGITRDRELSHVAVEGGKVVGALWTAFDGDNYEWDVAVLPEAQRRGVGSRLVDLAVSQFSEFQEANPDADMKIHVTSPVMEEMLKKRGFASVKSGRLLHMAKLAHDMEPDDVYLRLAQDPVRNRGRLEEMVERAAKAAFPDSLAIEPLLISRENAADKPLLKLYHGSEGAFTEFQIGRETKNDYGVLGTVETKRHGVFFAENEAYAKTFAEKGGTVMEVFLDIKKPFGLSDAQDIVEKRELGGDFTEDFNMAHWFFSRATQWEAFDDSEGAAFVAWLKKKGFDGAVIDERGTGLVGEPTQTVWVALDAAQIKSARTVELDDAGNVIPLSKRFTASPDIRGERDGEFSLAPATAARGMRIEKMRLGR